MTWSSEHYSIDFVKSNLENMGFDSVNIEKIGSEVYPPLSNFYINNRNSLKEKIIKKYPEYVEKILFKSLKKMKQAYEKKIIDYIFVICQKKQNYHNSF